MEIPIPTAKANGAPLKLESVGGAVPLDSPFYIARTADTRFHSAIARHEAMVLVRGARQMGKTSLLARGLQQARSSGDTVILTDIQKLNSTELQSSETFWRTLADQIADQLDLDVLPDDVWEPGASPSSNFERYLQSEVLPKIHTRLLWGLDELDRLFVGDYGKELFALFRSWHQERAGEAKCIWKQLTLAISYATEASLFIRDLNLTPPQEGILLTLEDFSPEQVNELSRRYGQPLRHDKDLIRFYEFLGGHPFLVRRGLHEMVVNRCSLDAIEAHAEREDGIFGDHLRRIPLLLEQDPSFREVVRSVFLDNAPPDPEAFQRLKDCGLLRGDSPADSQPRCQLYVHYLKRHLR